jgi:hypothetical protein
VAKSLPDGADPVLDPPAVVADVRLLEAGVELGEVSTTGTDSVRLRNATWWPAMNASCPWEP